MQAVTQSIFQALNTQTAAYTQSGVTYTYVHGFVKGVLRVETVTGAYTIAVPDWATVLQYVNALAALPAQVKAVSLHQPWATLLAAGVKQIETRSWPTKYRGPLAIHASKQLGPDILELCRRAEFYRPLDKLGYRTARHLPLGAVIGLGYVTAAKKIITLGQQQQLQVFKENHQNYLLPPSAPEVYYGDYTAGRYAWLFNRLRRFTRPYPQKGALQLWDYTLPAAELAAWAGLPPN